MSSTLTTGLCDRLPCLTELVGSSAVHGWWDGRRAAYLWRIERDLAVLGRYVDWRRLAAAYRASLRNPEELVAVAYELRTAAKLAPVADDLTPRPSVGGRACDLAVRLGGHEVFLEVTTRDDVFPWRRGDEIEDPPLTARETIHPEFRTTTPDPVVPTLPGVPASEAIRQAIRREVGQPPDQRLCLVVLGTPKSHVIEIQDALFGDGQLGRRGLQRVPNGLFEVPDEKGGLSRIGGLVWLELRHHWHDLRTHGDVFVNRRARRPLPSTVVEVLGQVFDPVSVLIEERDRVTRVLVEEFGAARVIAFGSLAADFPERVVHEASDIDLAVVKTTTARFVDRVREAVDVVKPRLGLNLFVFTPDEIARAADSGPSFIRDEILGKGKQLFPRDG